MKAMLLSAMSVSLDALLQSLGFFLTLHLVLVEAVLDLEDVSGGIGYEVGVVAGGHSREHDRINGCENIIDFHTLVIPYEESS